MEKISLSVCLILFNEKNNLTGTLESINGIADEVIIVGDSMHAVPDLPSEIQEICRGLIQQSTNIKFFNYPFNNDFSEIRNFAIEKAAGDWILFLDAGEALD